MKQQIILGIIRHCLSGLGVLLIQHGYANQNGVNQILGAVMTLIGLGWSAYHKTVYCGDGDSDTDVPTGGNGDPAGSPTAGVSRQNFTGLIIFGLLFPVSCLLISSPAFADTNASASAGASTNWLDRVGQKINFGGVFTVAPGQSPAQGPAVEWAAWNPVIKDVALNVGPAYTLGTTGSGTVHHYFEVAGILKLANTPAVAQITSNAPFLRNAAAFAGLGARIESKQNIAASFGLTFAF